MATAGNRRPCCASWKVIAELAVIAGKNAPFSRAAVVDNTDQDFGTDGGAHAGGTAQRRLGGRQVADRRLGGELPPLADSQEERQHAHAHVQPGREVRHGDDDHARHTAATAPATDDHPARTLTRPPHPPPVPPRPPRPPKPPEPPICFPPEPPPPRAEHARSTTKRRTRMHTKFRIQLIAIMAVVLLSGGSLPAQPHVNHERGLHAESYLSDTFDDVNLYNGNLTLTVRRAEEWEVV